jgi:hypothetical protein
MNIAVDILRCHVIEIGEHGMLLQECVKFKSTTFEDAN